MVIECSFNCYILQGLTIWLINLLFDEIGTGLSVFQSLSWFTSIYFFHKIIRQRWHNCFFLFVTELNVSHNKIHTVPDELNQLCELTSADVSHNQLVDIPEGLCNMANLRRLSLCHNHISGTIKELVVYYPTLESQSMAEIWVMPMILHSTGPRPIVLNRALSPIMSPFWISINCLIYL